MLTPVNSKRGRVLGPRWRPESKVLDIQTQKLQLHGALGPIPDSVYSFSKFLSKLPHRFKLSL